MYNELIKKAKSASSTEELLKIAQENGMQEFTEENAKAYFEAMHKSGELSDDELESAAGGCKSNNRRVVTLGYVCPVRFLWRCKRCLNPQEGCHCGWDLLPETCEAYRASMFPNTLYTCGTCGWCSYESGIWYCNNSEANKF